MSSAKCRSFRLGLNVLIMFYAQFDHTPHTRGLHCFIMGQYNKSEEMVDTPILFICIFISLGYTATSLFYSVNKKCKYILESLTIKWCNTKR